MPKPTPGRDFYLATEDEIRAGRTTDVYFVRTLDILKKAGRSRANVVAEATTGGLPNDWPWGIFCGLEEVVRLLQGKAVSLWSLPEGSVFPPKTPRGVPVPVLTLEGPYEEWALYETPLLGMICQASGIATKAARIRKLANGKQVLSFGVRRMHPGIAPLIERSVTIGGLDAITTPLGADLLGAPAMGTMPHALVIVMGGPREAFAAVHKYLEAKIPRIALVDTYYDEKTEALLAVEAIPDLAGIRLDTPASRRGNLPAIVREVRRDADVSHLWGENGPRVHAVLGPRSLRGAVARPLGNPGACEARRGTGRSRVSEPLSSKARVFLRWSHPKRRFARRTNGSPIRSRRLGVNRGLRWSPSLNRCHERRGSWTLDPGTGGMRGFSHVVAAGRWHSTFRAV